MIRLKEGRKKEEEGYVKWLFELSNKDVAIAGGKGASLAEMYRNSFPVPPAFIVTAQAFEAFISAVNEQIKNIIEITDVDKTDELNESSKKIRELVEKQAFPKEMEKEILEAYEILGTEKRDAHITGDAMNILRLAKEPVFVAVRSSATTEDLAEASFAGQQDTFLNVKGNPRLLASIKKCFSSLYTPRAIYYRDKQGFKNVKALLSVVVQKMINSEKSGVMFTKNPVKKDSTVVIEAVFGLGEGIVSGRIHPDNYVVNTDLEILDKKIADKKKALVRNASGETEEIKLTKERSNQQVLTEGQIKELADIGLKIEEHYKKPQDIEFAIEDNKVYIVQSRPITTLGKEIKTKHIEGKVLLNGLAASPGVASGKVKIVNSMNDLSKVKKGDILVTEMTNPDMVVTMQRNDAIVTDEGGSTSHAAIVSREMGIPCVVGTKNATKLLKDGQIITVDGATGNIYEGEVGEEKKKEILPIVETKKTRVKVILDLPEFAERAALTKCDSVGLLRLEGIIAMSGKHPLHFVKEKRMDAYSDIIKKGVEKISEPFDSVWVRASDIRSDEYRNLEGSPKEIEMNPMLGFHGIRFSLKHKDILQAELKAIRKVAEKFPLKKIGIMFPQIINVKEAVEARKEFLKIRTENMEFGIMVETPAAVQIIQELCDVGLDFISFGTNDLTQYTLAVDRNNEDVQDIYNELHPAILRQLIYVIRICKKNGVKTSICGQAGSKLEMVELLVREGINSISVNADSANAVSQLIHELEEKELEKKEPEPIIRRITQEIGESNIDDIPETISSKEIEIKKTVHHKKEKAEYIKSQMEESEKPGYFLNVNTDFLYTPEFQRIQQAINNKIQQIKSGNFPEKTNKIEEKPEQSEKQKIEEIEKEIQQVEQEIKDLSTQSSVVQENTEKVQQDSEGHEILDIF